MKIINSFIALSFIFCSFVVAQEKDNIQLGQPIRAYLNLNNITTIFKNTGISDINITESRSGFIFPKGSGKTAVFISGFLWGTLIPGDPQPRVGGSAYREGLQGGKILSPGVAEDPELSHVRIYRVRRDVYPGGTPVKLSVSGKVKNTGSSTITAYWYIEGQFYADNTYTLLLGGDVTTINLPLNPGVETLWNLELSDPDIAEGNYPNFALKELVAFYTK